MTFAIKGKNNLIVTNANVVRHTNRHSCCAFGFFNKKRPCFAVRGGWVLSLSRRLLPSVSEIYDTFVVENAAS
jgi:hypothetical protein